MYCYSNDVIISVQVRHTFAQCITAMAHHQYLELEGGHKLVEFIVRQCAISDEEVGWDGLMLLSFYLNYSYIWTSNFYFFYFSLEKIFIY